VPDCPFCQVVRGELPAYVVLEDDTALAFLDRTPAARGHVLVVPRVHATDLWEVDPDSAAGVMRTAHAAAALLRDRLHPDGLTLRQNNGAASGQRVDHLHVHLVPRWHGDGTVGWPWPPPQDLDLAAVLADLTGA
jgi:histidine triad (HIT) family protein